ncbi:MAG: trypsin-like peptidase domain-containing protein, partial [Acidobacteria bacterium]|nr:trypsin-like peptidase domain-containing protein [Acidobacteriota bacterium]
AGEPWKTDMRAQYLMPMMGATPRIKSLLAFFPGHNEPYRLNFKKSSSSVDLTVCTLDGNRSWADIPALPLDKQSEAVEVGKAVVTMGYPSGPNRLLALLPEAEAVGLQNRYGASLVTLLDQLAKRKLIKPLTTQGHITDLYTNRIVFDAATGEGASGTPIFGQSGRVIGVTFAVFIENSASNFAAPVSSGIALLESAGWRQK